MSDCYTKAAEPGEADLPLGFSLGVLGVGATAMGAWVALQNGILPF